MTTATVQELATRLAGLRNIPPDVHRDDTDRTLFQAYLFPDMVRVPCYCGGHALVEGAASCLGCGVSCPGWVGSTDKETWERAIVGLPWVHHIEIGVEGTSLAGLGDERGFSMVGYARGTGLPALLAALEQALEVRRNTGPFWSS